jgi:LysR family transcriptional regulator, pca operon transcriptional activator
MHNTADHRVGGLGGRMELRQIVHFLALAEHRSFRAAAASVHLTQQAVSKSVAQLESRLGVKLFERRGRTVELSAFGELLLPHARAVTAELRQFDDQLDAQRGLRSARLRLGATPTLLEHVVPETLRRLLETHSRTALMVQSADWDTLEPKLLRGELDLLLTTEPVRPVDALICYEPLCTERTVVVTAVDHPILRSPEPLAKLGAYPWISITNLPRADADLRTAFSTIGRRVPVARMRTESPAFALAWVERTEFLCALPSRAAARHIDSGRIAPLGVELSDARWNLVIAWRRDATQTPPMRKFLELVKQVVR